MEEQLKNETTRRLVLAVVEGDVTVDHACAVRADQARLAERCAERVDRARSAGDYGAARRWTEEYRRAAMQCRLLGKQLRRAPRGPEPTGPGGAGVLAHLASRPRAGIPPAGKAA
jgi:hypothetical protein